MNLIFWVLRLHTDYFHLIRLPNIWSSELLYPCVNGWILRTAICTWDHSQNNWKKRIQSFSWWTYCNVRIVLWETWVHPSVTCLHMCFVQWTFRPCWPSLRCLCTVYVQLSCLSQWPSLRCLCTVYAQLSCLSQWPSLRCLCTVHVQLSCLSQWPSLRCLCTVYVQLSCLSQWPSLRCLCTVYVQLSCLSQWPSLRCLYRVLMSSEPASQNGQVSVVCVPCFWLGNPPLTVAKPQVFMSIEPSTHTG